MVTTLEEGRRYSPSQLDLMREIEGATNPIELLVSKEKEGLVLPKKVLIIADGNGRWAQERGFPVTEGHRQGAEALKNLLRNFRSLESIDTVMIWAFSPDNFGRPREEVDGIMNVIQEGLMSTIGEIIDANGRFIHLGERERLGPKLLKAVDYVHDLTVGNPGQTVALAINYDGQQEETRGWQKFYEGKTTEEIRAMSSISAKELRSMAMPFIDVHGLGAVDFVIRTGGEQRTSGFGWRADMAELYSPKPYLPEFGARDLAFALADFAFRDRRFGGRSSSQTV